MWLLRSGQIDQSIFVSKQPCGAQQSHPFIRFWLKKCLKNCFAECFKIPCAIFQFHRSLVYRTFAKQQTELSLKTILWSTFSSSIVLHGKTIAFYLAPSCYTEYKLSTELLKVQQNLHHWYFSYTIKQNMWEHSLI